MGGGGGEAMVLALLILSGEERDQYYRKTRYSTSWSLNKTASIGAPCWCYEYCYQIKNEYGVYITVSRSKYALRVRNPSKPRWRSPEAKPHDAAPTPVSVEHE